MEEEYKIYEISFHIVPSVGEEDAKKEFEGIKKIIEAKEGASFIAEGLPALRTLAYSISKTTKAVKTNYSKAYFGWVKFTAQADQIAEIKKEIDEVPTIIRYLIISTVRENTMITKQEVEEMEKDSIADVEVPHLIDVDIDKTIDELVVQ